MNKSVLGSSLSLGFWTRHAEPVDKIYEADGDEKLLAPELLQISADPIHGPLFERITAAAEADAEAMLNSAIDHLAEYYLRDARLKITSKRVDPWHKRIEMRLKRDRSAARCLLNFYIETCNTPGMCLTCALWTAGGWSGELRNADVFQKITTKRLKTGKEDSSETDWDRGILLLARVNFADHPDSGNPLALDSEAVVAELIREVESLTSEPVVEILKALK